MFAQCAPKHKRMSPLRKRRGKLEYTKNGLHSQPNKHAMCDDTLYTQCTTSYHTTPCNAMPYYIVYYTTYIYIHIYILLYHVTLVHIRVHAHTEKERYRETERNREGGGGGHTYTHKLFIGYAEHKNAGTHEARVVYVRYELCRQQCTTQGRTSAINRTDKMVKRGKQEDGYIETHKNERGQWSLFKGHISG